MNDATLVERALRGSIAACGIGMSLCRGVYSQEVGGHIEGQVVISASSVVAATITISCQQAPGSRSTTSNAQGRFWFRSLPPGVCELHVSAPGHGSVRITDVPIGLGRTTSLANVRLEPQAVELTEVVVSARGGVDPRSAALTSSLRAFDLAPLPTGRTFRDALALAPQVDASYLPDDGANVAGGSGPETAYFIDGVNVTEGSLAAGGIQIPVNFIDEVQVTSGGYSAGAAGATGGVVNVVTRTGGLDLRGALFAYITGDRLSGAPRFSSASVSELGHRLLDLGGWFSGPVVRERLSFFVGYDPAFQRQRVGLAGLQPVTVRRSTHPFAGKLAWRVSRRAEASLSLFGDPGFRERVDPFFAVDSIGNLDAVLSKGRVGGIVITGDMRLRIGSAAQLSVGASRQQRADDARPSTVRGRTQALYFDVPANTLTGGMGIASRLWTSRTSGSAGLRLTVGSHAVTGGAEYEHNAYDFNLTYGLALDGYQGAVLRLDDTTYLWVRGYDAGRVANRVTAAFLQDTWSIGDRLTVSGGMRWTDQRLVSSSGRVMQRFAGAWQPRAGLVYLLGPSGTQRITLSAGRIYETFPANLARSYQQSRRQLITGYDHDPRTDSTGADTIYALLSSPPLAARALEGQSLDEVSAGYDRLIGDNWTVAFRVHHRRLRWAVEDTFDPATGESLIGNPGRGALSFLPVARHEYTALIVSASGPLGPLILLRGSYVLSRVFGNYEGLYDYAQLESFPNTSSQMDTPEQVPNSTGLLPNDRTHAVKVNATLDPRRGWALGVTATLTSGTPRNELGASTFGFPSYVFLRPRGSAGRTPTLIEVAVRASWIVPGTGSTTLRVIADAEHLGNRRAAVRYDDAQYLAQDGSGNQTVLNPNYGRGLAFQPPFSARLGFVAEF